MQKLQCWEAGASQCLAMDSSRDSFCPEAAAAGLQAEEATAFITEKLVPRLKGAPHRVRQATVFDIVRRTL